jgi:hypothetical protein
VIRPEPAVLDRPIFVVGCPRSGTTYLAGTLGRHPAIAHFPKETMFFRHMYGWLEEGVLASDLERARLARDFLAGWMGSYLRGVGKRRILEKTPMNVHVVSWLLASFADARVLHIYRDPRAVAASFSASTQHWTDHMAPELAAEMWRTEVGLALDKGVGAPDRFLNIRYEDLVAHPVDGFRDVLEFLGEPTEPLLPHVLEATDRSRVDRWKEVLPPFEVEAVERICAELMSRLGYPLTLPVRGTAG